MLIRDLLVSWIVHFLLSTAQCAWLEEMERICGPVVDDLFYKDEDLAGKEEKCRLMRAAFKCIELETKKKDPENWKFMVDTQQIGNISITVANTCQKESLILCPRYKMNRRIQQCYNRTGIHDMDWTCSAIKKYASLLNQTLSCMTNEIRRCPNDDFIKDDIVMVGNWTDAVATCDSAGMSHQRRSLLFHITSVLFATMI